MRRNETIGNGNGNPKKKTFDVDLKERPNNLVENDLNQFRVKAKTLIESTYFV